MRLKSSIAAAVFAAMLASCNSQYHEDFPIVVVNRTGVAAAILADGQRVGTVGPSQTASFTLRLTTTGYVTSDSTGNPTSPSVVAHVRLAAQDSHSGAISDAVSATLREDVPNYLEVFSTDACPLCVSASSSPPLVCTYRVASNSQAFSEAGGIGTLSISTTPSICAWTASTDAPWITILVSSSGNGSATVSFRVAANTTQQPRTATIRLAGQTITVTQAAP